MFGGDGGYGHPSRSGAEESGRGNECQAGRLLFEGGDQDNAFSNVPNQSARAGWFSCSFFSTAIGFVWRGGVCCGFVCVGRGG